MRSDPNVLPSLSSSEQQPARIRWVMIGFAFAATLINYLDRQTLSVVAPALRDEFQMSNEAYGYVLSAFVASLVPEAQPVADALTFPATIGEVWMVGYLLHGGVFRGPAAEA